jgi:hypothetical protein
MQIWIPIQLQIPIPFRIWIYSSYFTIEIQIWNKGFNYTAEETKFGQICMFFLFLSLYEGCPSNRRNISATLYSIYLFLKPPLPLATGGDSFRRRCTAVIARAVAGPSRSRFAGWLT